MATALLAPRCTLLTQMSPIAMQVVACVHIVGLCACFGPGDSTFGVCIISIEAGEF